MWVGVTTDEISALVPIKSDLSAVKCTSWKGLSVTIYCREKQPIAFECDELIFPTGSVAFVQCETLRISPLII